MGPQAEPVIALVALSMAAIAARIMFQQMALMKALVIIGAKLHLQRTKTEAQPTLVTGTKILLQRSSVGTRHLISSKTTLPPTTRFSKHSVLQRLQTRTSTTNKDSSDTSQIEDVPNSSYVQISDTSNTYSLAADPDGGNIYISAAGQGTYFASVSSFIVGDDSDNFLHYYPDVMAAYNVSRLRLSPKTAMPKTADLVAFAPVDTDGSGDTASVYAALDTLGNVFVTVVCDIEGQNSKLFLVRDAEQGVVMLKEEKLDCDRGCCVGLLFLVLGRWCGTCVSCESVHISFVFSFPKVLP